MVDLRGGDGKKVAPQRGEPAACAADGFRDQATITAALDTADRLGPLRRLPKEARESLGTQVPHPRRLGRPDDFSQLPHRPALRPSAVQRARDAAGRQVGARMPAAAPAAPVIAIAKRFALALVIVILNWGLVVLERDSYHDNADGRVSVIDALYYTTVTLSTTGYGDITPVTTSARLLNAVVVTPMRLLFVVILVGTTIQALTERSREQFRLTRWRSRVRDHVIICGYGAKGRNAVRALLLKGRPTEKIVVVDTDPRAIAEAAEAGFVTVDGSATRTEVLTQALVERASTVIIALDRDDTSVLVTLTARQLAPQVTVVATAREAENADLLRQSGAASVIVTSATAGRLLGLAADSPDTVDVVEDLLSFGAGLDLLERDVVEAEVGHAPGDLVPAVLAVVRDGRRHYYDDPEVSALLAGDRVVQVQSPQTGGDVQAGVRFRGDGRRS